MRVLVIEDEAKIADYVKRGLSEAGYTVDVARDGIEGRYLALEGDYQLVVLDIMLPGIDGFGVLSALRQKRGTPVLMLTARDRVEDRVQGLQAGADDYLVKPFVLSELLARIEAIARRSGQYAGAAGNALRVHSLVLDRLTRQVSRAGEEIQLKPQEYRVLEYLMRHAGQVVTRSMLLEGVWEYHFDPQTNVIDVHMSRLRAKVDKAPWPALIHTLRGAGYCLREPS